MNLEWTFLKVVFLQNLNPEILTEMTCQDDKMTLIDLAICLDHLLYTQQNPRVNWISQAWNHWAIPRWMMTNRRNVTEKDYYRGKPDHLVGLYPFCAKVPAKQNLAVKHYHYQLLLNNESVLFTVSPIIHCLSMNTTLRCHLCPSSTDWLRIFWQFHQPCKRKERENILTQMWQHPLIHTIDEYS